VSGRRWDSWSLEKCVAGCLCWGYDGPRDTTVGPGDTVKVTPKIPMKIHSGFCTNYSVPHRYAPPAGTEHAKRALMLHSSLTPTILRSETIRLGSSASFQHHKGKKAGKSSLTFL
jgi:hypothetical protein